MSHSTNSATDLGFELPPPARGSRIRVIVVLAIVCGAAFAYGYAKHRTTRAGAIVQSTGGVVRVETTKAKVLTSDRAVALPGIVRALQETKIYPRTTGYVKRWLVDIGDKVKEGQLLAEIASPETEANLAQASAQLEQAKAAVKLAVAQRDYSRANLARNQLLLQQSLIAQTTVEQIQSQAGVDVANVAAAEAAVVAAQANVNRLRELLAYAKVVAPFAGTVTTRTIEVGTALVGDTATTALFTIDATDPVRVFVDAPQSIATAVADGSPATVSAREYPGRTFAGKVERSAGALDPDLHTMSTAITVPNHDGALLPGMYVQVTLELPVPHRVLEIPATALYDDARGVRVAVVDAHSHIRFTPVAIERDTGATLLISSGLTEDQPFVKIAVPSLAEGDPVEVAPPATGSAATPAAK